MIQYYKVIFLFLLFYNLINAQAVKILDYGFEDWLGDAENRSPAPGYIFSTGHESFWNDHRSGTEVISSCNGVKPVEGDYFWHLSWFTSGEDSCLGTTPTSINSHNVIGYNGRYPSGIKDTTELAEDISSNIITIRFYFRCTGDWTSSQTNLDAGGGLKFIRLYGTGGAGDASSALVKILNDGDDIFPRYFLFNPSGDPNYGIYYDSDVNFQDGDWHTVSFVVVRNNDNNIANNITLTVWWDDWNMNTEGQSLTVTAPEFGDGFHHFDIGQNWSAKYPVNPISMDIDKIEVWDGLPSSSSTSQPEPVQQLKIEPVSGE